MYVCVSMSGMYVCVSVHVCFRVWDHVLPITWQDMIPDTEVLKRAKQSCSTEESSTSAGHVVRISDERLPKHLLYGELAERRRSTGS